MPLPESFLLVQPEITCNGKPHSLGKGRDEELPVRVPNHTSATGMCLALLSPTLSFLQPSGFSSQVGAYVGAKY